MVCRRAILCVRAILCAPTVNIVSGNLKSENSQDYAQKPQQNCTFMNSASVLVVLAGSNPLSPGNRGKPSLLKTKTREFSLILVYFPGVLTLGDRYVQKATH